MTDTTNPGNWPDPERPGVPLNPDRDGLHYITDGVALWEARRQRWSLFLRARRETAEWLGKQLWAEYRGPCLTPDEVAAREKAAYKRGWDDRESDFCAGIERTGLAVVAPDALAAAYRAGAEAMREACAENAEAYGWLSNKGCWRVSERQESAFDAADKIASAIRELPIPAQKDTAP
jgi:hypothetical protein